MATPANVNVTPEDKAAAERKAKLTEAEKTAEATNKGRNGKGTRVRVGQTRGKNPQVISFEQFDDSLPATLPADADEFVKMTTPNPAQLLDWLIRGYNDAQYTAASDPIAEFVDASWNEETQNRFRAVVRNFASGAQIAIEDAVTLVKPSFVAAANKAATPAA